MSAGQCATGIDRRCFQAATVLAGLPIAAAIKAYPPISSINLATSLMAHDLQNANRTSSPWLCDMQIFSGETESMSFGERLKTARKKRFQQQKEAAEYLGVPIGTYANHETSNRNPKREVVERYAKAFGVTAAWLSHDEGAISAVTVVPLAGFISAGGAIDTSGLMQQPHTFSLRPTLQ